MKKSYLAVEICGLLTLVGCGGTSDVERKEKPVHQPATGVDFYDCASVTATYEFELLSDASSFDGGYNIRNQDPVYFYSNNDETNPARALTSDEIEKQNLTRPPCDCEPDQESAPEGGETIQPVEGGAPSLSEGSLCMPSRSSIQLVSRGMGFTDWGMVFGASFELDNLETEESGDKVGIDASLWDGVAVWVKRESSDALSMFASVVDQYTVSKGGYCQDEGLLENACDAFGVGVGFESQWRLTLLPFDKLSQRGFGKGSPFDVVQVQDLSGFAFYMPSGVWDVRVDELALYRKK